MREMEPITCKNAYYVKLGQNGVWEDSSIAESKLQIGWSKQTLSDINKGRWDIIQKQLEADIPNKGTVTKDCRALRMLCESTPDDIWITFHASQLWWCKVAEQRIFEDKVSKYRKVEGWHCKNIFGTPLLINQIPGRIAKVQGFRGTICKVKEVEELTGLINRKYSSEFVAISHSKVDLCRHVETGLRRLHWKDFETLVDLLFRATGWRRVSFLGGNMKYVDIELEEPINGEMYQFQVKSSATLREFQEYAKKFQSGKYRKLFFVVHTPDKKLIEMSNQKENSVQLVLPGRLAEMVVDLGMVGWLLNKIR